MRGNHGFDRSILACVLLLVVGWSASPVRSQEASDVEQSAVKLVEPAIPSIERGLAYLAGEQQADGSFGPSGYGRNVAVVGLAGMAFLSSGSTPDRGPYGEEISLCVDFLLKHTQESGFIVDPGSTSHGPMYGHGFATLFLAEAYGMSPRDDLRDKLSKAVNLIVNCQNDEGGWRYQPRPMDADVSVTICQVMALRAARNAGLHVPAETIDRSIEYVKRCQNPDGGFGYTTQDRTSLFPRSAAGVVALYSAGVYEGEEVESGLKYLLRENPNARNLASQGHFFYGHYYAVQAMWLSGGDRWDRWYPLIRNTLVERQRNDGSWLDTSGPQYATAMACIILQVPNNMVPIFQR
jgi:prenyltransferase beta subunit